MYSTFIFKCLIKPGVVFLLLAWAVPGQAQYNYSQQNTYRDFDASRSNEILLYLNNLNFIKNNEYSGEAAEGYTLLGYDFEPSLVYYAGARLRLQAGIHAQKYHGQDDFSQVLPVLSAHLKLSHSTALVMGALKGHVHHRLPEPLFEPERQFTRPVEVGLQLLMEHRHFWLDTWLDWEEFVEAGDAFPEKFTFGLSSQIGFNDSTARWQTSIPVSLTTTHTGGQISNYPEPVQTVTNLSTGIQFHRQWTNRQVKKAGIFALHMRYNNLNDENRLGINNGHAWYMGTSLQAKSGNAMLAWFSSRDFISPLGSALFQSVSGTDPNWHKSRRNLITGKIDYHRTFLKEIKFTFRFEAYYDPGQNQFDFANTLLITFTPGFYIARASFF